MRVALALSETQNTLGYLLTYSCQLGELRDGELAVVLIYKTVRTCVVRRIDVYHFHLFVIGIGEVLEHFEVVAFEQ